MKKHALKAVLENNNVRTHTLVLSSDAEVLVCERGGRILGIFNGAESDNLLWTSPELADDARAAAFLKSEAWNIGGDRLWFGPELRYSVGDRTRFWETLHTPEEIDPGCWYMDCLVDGVEFSQRMRLNACDGSQIRVSADVRNHVHAVANPVRALPDGDELMRGVKYAGFTQHIHVEGGGEGIEPWQLMQVMPGGRVYIPMFRPARGVDYYERAAPFEEVTAKGTVLRATGCNRYKVGYKAAEVAGRIGYACRWNGEACLLVRSFPNDPSGLYEEEPPLMPGEKGFSVHVYNDGDAYHGFTELECSMPSVFADGRPTGDDTVSTWIFTGEETRLQSLSRLLLGFECVRFD